MTLGLREKFGTTRKQFLNLFPLPVKIWLVASFATASHLPLFMKNDLFIFCTKKLLQLMAGSLRKIF
jgi:hypothetical protein